MTYLQRTFLSTTVLSVLCISSVATSSATTIIHDTTGFADDTLLLVGLSSSGSGTINQPADSFVISGGSYFLETITLELTSSSIQSGGTPDDYEVRIWDNVVDKPGNLLETITILGSDAISGDTTVNSLSNPLLVNGDTYWVSAALPDDQSFGLLRTVQTATNGRAVAFSGSAAASWVAISSTAAFRLKVTGILVPEPTTSALALAALGLAMSRRRSF